jgi:WD40 repeat protein
VVAGTANTPPVGGDTGPAWTVAFSPDGSTLASADAAGTVRLWDTNTGALHYEFPVPAGAGASSVAFSPDGYLYASGGADGTVRLWNTGTEALHQEFPVTGGPVVVSVAFSPDGSTLASADADGTVRLWDTNTGALHYEFPVPAGAGASSVAFSPDGSILASGGAGTVRLWDTGTGDLHHKFAVTAGPVAVSVAFSPDGSTLASGGADGTVRLWDTSTWAGRRQVAVPVSNLVLVAFSPDGSILASCAGGAVRLWDTDTLALHHEFPVPAGPVMFSVAFSPDDSTLASGGADGTVRLWDTSTGTLRREFPVPAGAGASSVVFSLDSSTQVSGGADETVQPSDAPTGKRSAPRTDHMPDDGRRPFGATRTAYGLAFAYVVLAGGLIVLRAFDQDFSFLGVGWILVFALVPLLPWLVPAVAPWFGRMAPYIQNVRIGSVLELRLRDAEPRVASLGQVSSVLSVRPLETTGAGQFTSTDALEIINSMNELHNKRAELVIVELEGGTKWRYPNLYFLARLLEADPEVRQMIFTEARGGEGGFLVCMCSPSELRKRLEAAVPAYAESGRHLSIPADMTAPGLHDALKQQFDAFRQALTPARAQYPEAEGWVRSAELVKLLGTVCNRVSIEAKDPLTDDDYRTILLSRFRYVATVADGRFSSVIDQVPLATAFARTVLSMQK